MYGYTMSFDHNIVAIATPPGRGAIGIVRISGNNSYLLAERLVVQKKKWRQSDIQSLQLFSVIDVDGNPVDDVLMVKFKSPHSFSGEDIVEIHCHGSFYTLHKIVDLLLDHGARLAEPGEFTKRAFLNGKIDLVQAESLDALIASKSQSAAQLSLENLHGHLSKKLLQIRTYLKEQCALLELELDFAEEDVEFVSRNDFIHKTTTIIVEIRNLLSSFQMGRILQEGVYAALIGRPNVGKSSLLNSLLRADRAIVTEEPGTTRDTLQEQIDIRGILFNLIDTAGLRPTHSQIEALGISRAQKAIDQSDILIFIFDAHETLQPEDKRLLQESASWTVPKIFVLNKNDLQQNIESDKLKLFSPDAMVSLSAKSGKGIEKLEEILYHLIYQKHSAAGQTFFITRKRHQQELLQAQKELENALASLKQNFSSEFVVADLYRALDHIGSITGHVTREDILNDIFTSFCIGK